MNVKHIEKTVVGMDENFLTQYEKKSFLGIITWWSVVKSTSMGKDLIISTEEKYDRIILNGKELQRE